MAIQYNQITREGFANSVLTTYLANGGNCTLRFYSATVPYPNTPSGIVSMLTGHILQTTVARVERVGSTLSFRADMNTSIATVGAGPIVWWAIGPGGASPIISDSVGLSGSGSIMTVNTMNPAALDTLTFSLNLSVV